jgi:hypothetical protein
MIDRNFATIAMLAAMFLVLTVLVILVSMCGVKAESPLAVALAGGAVSLSGAIAGLAIPRPDKPPADTRTVTTVAETRIEPPK